MLLHLYTILIAAHRIGLSTTHSRCLRPVFRHVRHACLCPSSMCRLSHSQTCSQPAVMSHLHAMPSCTSLIRFLHMDPTCPALMSSPHGPHFFTPMPSCHTLSHTLLYSLHAIPIYHMQMLHADDTPSYWTHICRIHIIPQQNAYCPPYIPNHDGTHICPTSYTMIYNPIYATYAEPSFHTHIPYTYTHLIYHIHIAHPYMWHIHAETCRAGRHILSHIWYICLPCIHLLRVMPIYAPLMYRPIPTRVAAHNPSHT